MYKTEITALLEIKTNYYWKIWRKGQSLNKFIEDEYNLKTERNHTKVGK